MNKKHLAKKTRGKITTGILVCLLFTAGVSVMASQYSYSPVVRELKELYDNNPSFAFLVNDALKSAVVPPGGWAQDPEDPNKLFVWPEKNFNDLLDFFEHWRTFTPSPDNGMSYYELLYGLCYKNESALKFVEEEPGLSWTRNFVQARGKYMDSESSINDNLDKMKLWFEYMGPYWNDFKPPHPTTEGFKGYKTFNEFFTRELKPGKRPVAFPKDPHVLAAPADGLLNVINANLDTDSIIHTKYDEYLNVDQLLQGSKYAKHFLGGTAAAIVLLPPDYHHYHSPVTGEVVESKEVDVNGIYFGMDGGFFSYANNGNVGGYKAKYGIFGLYHRSYYIIKTTYFGYVGMISVGLDDISSVNFEKKFKNIKPPSSVPVKKGERLGHFAYGGSTVILLFEPGVFMGVRTRQGSEIGVINCIKNCTEAEPKRRPTLNDYFYPRRKR